MALPHPSSGTRRCGSYAGNMYRGDPLPAVPRPPAPVDRRLAAAPLLGFAGLVGTGLSNLQETNPLVWAMLAISIGGALVTFAFLAYSIWRFRDPRVRGRRYG